MENLAKQTMNVKQTAHATNASMVFVEPLVERPAPLHHNAVHPKDHVISVWWEFVQQEDVERPVLSNLIVLVMEIAPFVQRDTDALLNVEVNVLKTLIVVETSMDADHV